MMRLVRIEEDTHVKHEREECVFNHRIDDQFHFTPFLPFSSFQLSFFSSSFCSSSLLLKNEKTRERELKVSRHVFCVQILDILAHHVDMKDGGIYDEERLGSTNKNMNL